MLRGEAGAARRARPRRRHGDDRARRAPPRHPRQRRRARPHRHRLARAGQARRRRDLAHRRPRARRRRGPAGRARALGAAPRRHAARRRPRGRPRRRARRTPTRPRSRASTASRPAGCGVWRSGDEVVYRHRSRDGRYLFGKPLRILEDTPRAGRRVHPGRNGDRAAALADGSDLRAVPLTERWSHPRVPGRRTWSGDGTVMIFPRGRAHSIWFFRGPDVARLVRQPRGAAGLRRADDLDPRPRPRHLGAARHRRPAMEGRGRARGVDRRRPNHTRPRPPRSGPRASA